jgi:RAT1-interacting protein
MEQQDIYTFPFPSPTTATPPKTTIKRPQQLTTFSFDSQHICRPLSDESLRYYYPAMFQSPWVPNERGPDLSQGFEHFVKFDEGKVDTHLDALLETLKVWEEREGKVEVDVVTWRGMMTKVCLCKVNVLEGESC